jgi:hypothetical protein
MIHLYSWRATLSFLPRRLTPLLITVKHHLLLCVTPLDKKVQHRSLPMSDTMAYVPFPTIGISSNTQNWDHTPNSEGLDIPTTSTEHTTLVAFNSAINHDIDSVNNNIDAA